MQGETKICVQAHYVMENICINKHMFAQRKLQLTRIEFWIHACFFTKNSQKMAENLEKIWIWCSLLVMMLGDIVRVQGQLLDMVIQLKIPKKSEKHQKKIQMVLRMSWTGFSIHSRPSAYIYPNREISLGLTKSEEK